MTKPSAPSPDPLEALVEKELAASDLDKDDGRVDIDKDLVEIEAMDVEEWERDQHTPEAGDRLAALVKQTAEAPPPVPPARKTPHLARVVPRAPARPPSPGEPSPFDSPTLRNAGAAIPPTRSEALKVSGVATATSPLPSFGPATPIAKQPPPRPATPPAGVPLHRPATPAVGTPRPATPAAGTPAARRATPPAGTPTATPRPPAPPIAMPRVATPAAGTPVGRAPTPPPVDESEGWSLPDDIDEAAAQEWAARPASEQPPVPEVAPVASTPPVVVAATPAPITPAAAPPVVVAASAPIEPAVPLPTVVEAAPAVAPAAPVVPKAAPPAPITPPAPSAPPPVAMPPSPAPVLPPRSERAITTDSFPIVRPRSRKQLAIIAGAVGAVGLVMVIVLTRAPREPARTAAVDPPTVPTESGPADPVTEPPATDPPVTDPPVTDPPATDPPAVPRDVPATTSRPPRTGRTTPRGRPDRATTTTPPTTAELPAASGDRERARAAYSDGNQRLFAGDAAGAITAYREAIRHGSAAGYRGLGLAYEKQGDKANAIKAFKTYVARSPGAKDVPLIQKRISALGG